MRLVGRFGLYILMFLVMMSCSRSAHQTLMPDADAVPAQKVKAAATRIDKPPVFTNEDLSIFLKRYPDIRQIMHRYDEQLEKKEKTVSTIQMEGKRELDTYLHTEKLDPRDFMRKGGKIVASYLLLRREKESPGTDSAQDRILRRYAASLTPEERKILESRWSEVSDVLGERPTGF